MIIVNMTLKLSCFKQSPVVDRCQTHQQQFHDKRFDLLSDLGGDIFAAPASVNPSATSGFANFAHFNNHTSKKHYWVMFYFIFLGWGAH